MGRGRLPGIFGVDWRKLFTPRWPRRRSFFRVTLRHAARLASGEEGG